MSDPNATHPSNSIGAQRVQGKSMMIAERICHAHNSAVATDDVDNEDDATRNVLSNQSRFNKRGLQGHASLVLV